MSPDDIIRAQAARCLRRIGNHPLWSMGDLINEGQICLIHVRRCWKPDGGAAFNTYLTGSLMRHYNSLVKKSQKKTNHLDHDPEAPPTMSGHYDDDARQFQTAFHTGDDLSERASLLLKIISSPGGMVGIVEPKRRCSLARDIAKRLGWSPKILETVRQELSNSLICAA